MSNITPEMLKVVAEGMGYAAGKSTQNNYDVIAGGIVYNPLTNTEQCTEIIKKLKIATEWDWEDKVWVALIEMNRGMTTQYYIEETSKEWNEAVVLAAYDYFKEK